MMNKSLAICILFYEKIEQTLECVQSLLPAGVPVVVLNNGSSAESRKRFAAFCADYPQVHLLDVPTNLGVSGGRNYLIQHTSEEWLFFVDNDIVMSTTNWLELFACHAATSVEVLIPRLLNRHEGCYVEYRQIEVIGNKALFTAPIGSTTNSFPGGAALVNRKLFQRLGNYDELIFVGGEDFELALRGVLTGKPVRALVVGDVEMVHDHRCALDPKDKEAVLHRYDKQRIQQSFRRIREKHGIIIEDNWEGWVDQQIRMQVPGSEQLTEKGGPCTATCRPRIALVSDIRDWAFHNIALSIRKYLGYSYDIDIYYLNEYYPDLSKAASDLFTGSYDLVHFFWREGILHLFVHLMNKQQGITNEIVDGFIETPITFSIYDHCFLDPVNIDYFRIAFNYLAKGYTVSSARLDGIYQNLENYSLPSMVLEDGVDLSLFYPNALNRLDDTDREVIIGWVGNSSWGVRDGLDHKGLYTLIKPAISLLLQDGLPVVGRFADRKERHIPHSEMVHYYNSVDIYVCASDLEGTPNPILEAMACGLPIISTDVGIVPELFGPRQQEFILRQRTLPALREKLHQLILDPALRRTLSEENLERITAWTRQAESVKWNEFFETILSSSKKTGTDYIAGGRGLKKLCVEFPHNYMFVETVNNYLADSLSWKVTAPLRKVHYYFNYLLKKMRKTSHSGLL